MFELTGAGASIEHTTKIFPKFLTSQPTKPLPLLLYPPSSYPETESMLRCPRASETPDASMHRSLPQQRRGSPLGSGSRRAGGSTGAGRIRYPTPDGARPENEGSVINTPELLNAVSGVADFQIRPSQ